MRAGSRPSRSGSRKEEVREWLKHKPSRVTELAKASRRIKNKRSNSKNTSPAGRRSSRLLNPSSQWRITTVTAATEREKGLTYRPSSIIWLQNISRSWLHGSRWTRETPSSRSSLCKTRSMSRLFTCQVRRPRTKSRPYTTKIRKSCLSR